MNSLINEDDLFLEMTWQEFESFVIDVLNAIYSKTNKITINKTPDRNDGGKDGYAILHIDSTILSKIDDSLCYNALFWVEVKKRTNTNIGEVDIGGNVLLALNSNVNKLIFVSNKDFTDRTKEICYNVAKRLNTSVSFIDGQKLKALANNTNNISNYYNIKSQSTKPTSQEPFVSIVTGFVSKPEHVFNDSILSINTGEFVFWICEIAGFCNEPESYIRVLLNNQSSVFSFKCLSNDFLQLDNVETIQRIIYCIKFNQPGEYTCKDILQKFETDPKIKINYKSSGGFLNVNHSILNNSLPQSRKCILDDIENEIKILSKEKRIRGSLLEATAGNGKTFLITELRKRIMPLGIKEVFLDGAIHKSVADIARALTSMLLPLPLDLSSQISLSSFKGWTSSESFSENKQERVYSSLFKAIEDDFDNTFNVNDIISALALILSKTSKNNPIVLIFEDLHKVNTSVLIFIRNLVAQLVSRKEGIIYLIFSTRPQIETREESQVEWFGALTELCGSIIQFSQYFIKPFLLQEAVGLIKETLSGVSEQESIAIIEQVGTTPHNIKEALLYLESIHAIERNKNIGAYIIDNLKVKEAINSKSLQSSTKKRLQILIKNEGTELQKLLISAACLGKFFSVEAATTACANLSETVLNNLIAKCEKYNIFRFSNLTQYDSEIDCAFDHDLIRLSILQDAGTFELKQISTILIEKVSFSDASKTLLNLSFISGNSKLCQTTTKDLILKTKNTKSYRETLSYSLLNLAIYLRSGKHFDKSTFLRSHLNKIDESFAFVDIPQIKEKILPEALLDALLEPLEIMNKIGTFEKELTEKLITLGGLNSEAYPNSHYKSSFKFYEGKLFFSQSKYTKAKTLFKRSEDVWYQGKNSRSILLSKIRVWISICERTMGNLEQAQKEMRRAIKLRNSNDWELLSQVSANLGAFYMYDDQDIAKRHWERGLRIAKKTHNNDEIAHFLNDLGHIDIMLNNYSEAVTKISQAFEIAEKYGILKETIRSNIFLGCINIVENKLEIGTFSMKNAETEAFAQYNLRRLWRIYSNLATIAELDNKMNEAYIKDRQSLVSMPIHNEMIKVSSPSKRQTRVSGALVNIIERYYKNPELYADIKQLIPSEAWNYGIELQNILSKNKNSKTSCRIQSLYKNIKGTSIWRFIITE